MGEMVVSLDCPPPPVLRVMQDCELGKNLWGGVDSYSHPPQPGRTPGGGLVPQWHTPSIPREFIQARTQARTRPRKAKLAHAHDATP